MRRACILVLLAWVFSSHCLVAQGGPLLPSGVATPADTSSRSAKPGLRQAIEREARRVTLSVGRDRITQAQQPRHDRNWIRRHPTLFGALAGAGVGAVSSASRWNELYCATGGDEDCLFHGGSGVLFGAGVGAGIGALVGFLVSR